MARSLEIIDVASPCTQDWASMIGDAKSRFCAECQKNVYDLSAMTREEASALIEKGEGGTCVRFYRRKDGTVVTSECVTDAAIDDDFPPMLMGEIEMPDEPVALVPEASLDRDVVLAEVRRSLQHTHPDRADVLMREVERLVVRIAGADPAACPHCANPVFVQPGDSEELFLRDDEADK